MTEILTYLLKGNGEAGHFNTILFQRTFYARRVEDDYFPEDRVLIPSKGIGTASYDVKTVETKYEVYGDILEDDNEEFSFYNPLQFDTVLDSVETWHAKKYPGDQTQYGHRFARARVDKEIIPKIPKLNSLPTGDLFSGIWLERIYNEEDVDEIRKDLIKLYETFNPDFKYWKLFAVVKDSELFLDLTQPVTYQNLYKFFKHAKKGILGYRRPFITLLSGIQMYNVYSCGNLLVKGDDGRFKSAFDKPDMKLIYRKLNLIKNRSINRLADLDEAPPMRGQQLYLKTEYLSFTTYDDFLHKKKEDSLDYNSFYNNRNVAIIPLTFLSGKEVKEYDVNDGNITYLHIPYKEQAVAFLECYFSDFFEEALLADFRHKFALSQNDVSKTLKDAIERKELKFKGNKYGFKVFPYPDFNFDVLNTHITKKRIHFSVYTRNENEGDEFPHEEYAGTLEEKEGVPLIVLEDNYGIEFDKKDSVIKRSFDVPDGESSFVELKKEDSFKPPLKPQDKKPSFNSFIQLEKKKTFEPSPLEDTYDSELEGSLLELEKKESFKPPPLEDTYDSELERALSELEKKESLLSDGTFYSAKEGSFVKGDTFYSAEEGSFVEKKKSFKKFSLKPIKEPVENKPPEEPPEPLPPKPLEEPVKIDWDKLIEQRGPRRKRPITFNNNSRTKRKDYSRLRIDPLNNVNNTRAYTGNYSRSSLDKFNLPEEDDDNQSELERAAEEGNKEDLAMVQEYERNSWGKYFEEVKREHEQEENSSGEDSIPPPVPQKIRQTPPPVPQKIRQTPPPVSKRNKIKVNFNKKYSDLTEKEKDDYFEKKLSVPPVENPANMGLEKKLSYTSTLSSANTFADLYNSFLLGKQIYVQHEDFERINVIGDGNCMFYSLVKGLKRFGDVEGFTIEPDYECAARLRNMIADMALKVFWDDELLRFYIADIVAFDDKNNTKMADPNNFGLVQHWAKAIRKNGIWGDTSVLIVFTHLFPEYSIRVMKPSMKAVEKNLYFDLYYLSNTDLERLPENVPYIGPAGWETYELHLGFNPEGERDIWILNCPAGGYRGPLQIKKGASDAEKIVRLQEFLNHFDYLSPLKQLKGNQKLENMVFGV